MKRFHYQTANIAVLLSLFLATLTSCSENIAVPIAAKKVVPSSRNSITAVHPSDWPQAFKRFYNDAQRGDPIAQNNLGRMYSDGRGLPVDSQQAVYWFSKAASLGNIDAQLNLGACYLFGRGVTSNLNNACQLFRKAWLQGSEEGQKFYARYCQG